MSISRLVDPYPARTSQIPQMGPTVPVCMVICSSDAASQGAARWTGPENEDRSRHLTPVDMHVLLRLASRIERGFIGVRRCGAKGAPFDEEPQ